VYKESELMGTNICVASAVFTTTEYQISLPVRDCV